MLIELLRDQDAVRHRFSRRMLHVRHHPLLIATLLAVSCAVAPFTQSPGSAFLGKPFPEAIRVMTWNIAADSVFPADGRPVDVMGTGRPSQFARILRALQPDVMCLQEVTIAAERVARVADDILPLDGGRKWQAHAGVDNIIVSRFDLIARARGVAPGGIRRRGHAVALIRLPDAAGAASLYMTCAHFQSSNGAGDIASRQRHADAIVDTIRAAQSGRDAIIVPARTPFVILGDLNAVPGLTTFVETLLTGLDWDASSITDALPHHNSSGAETYTWRNDRERFPPSALDRVLYSDSVLGVAHAFVLNTTTMSPEELSRAGLRPADVMRDPAAGVHDHFPIVVDFRIGAAAAAR